MSERTILKTVALPADGDRTRDVLDNARVAGNVPRLARRREFLQAAAAGVVVAIGGAIGPLGALAASADESKKHALIPKTGESGSRRVRTIFEVQGTLRANGPNGKVVEMPLELVANQDFVERWLDGNQDGNPATARLYLRADADMRIDKGEKKTKLSEEHNLVAVARREHGPAVYSPLGPLTRDELELIDIPGNSMLLDSLVSGRATAIGETWKPDTALLAPLLCIDAISQSDVQCRLASVEKDVAVIDAAGKISGAVGGVASEISLTAKINFDLKSRLVTWLAMSIQEDRAIGHADAGFKATARVRTVVAPADPIELLADDAIKGLPLACDEGSLLLAHESAPGGFRFLHDRRWRMMADDKSLSVFRLIDQGELLAQCNLSQLADFPAGRQLTLEAFQDDIKRSLGNRFGQFIDATEGLSSTGLRLLRVTAAGTTDGLSILWVYCHLSDDSGRRLAASFSIEDQQFDRFADADQAILNTIEFIARPNAAENPTQAATETNSGNAGTPATSEKAKSEPASTGGTAGSPQPDRPSARTGNSASGKETSASKR